jgi:hypothetical protein
MLVIIKLIMLFFFGDTSNDGIKNEMYRLLNCHHSQSIYTKQYIYYYEDKKSNIYKSVDSSYYILTDKMIYQNPYNTERLVNKEYAIEVNNKEKRMIIIKNDESVLNELKSELFGINVNNLFNNTSDIKKTKKGDNLMLTFSYEVGLYDKVEIEYDSIKCKVISITLNYFKNYTTSENKGKTAPKAKIVYEYIEGKVELKNRLKTESYFTLKNNKFLPVEKYKHYEILY